MGSIVTFYSYKGGVGRSMALANIAFELSKRKFKVLVVDWDLEAPGIEKYFSTFKIENSSEGLLQLLLAFSEDGAPNYHDYLWKIDIQNDNPISLLHSGRDKDPAKYSSLLQAFDWSEFFSEKKGGYHLEGLRAAWQEDFDFVLIDSRTGLSDSSGICTILMPDILIPMFTANYQSLFGIRDTVKYIQAARQKLQVDRMALTVLPIPSRFGARVEFKESIEWLDRIADILKDCYSDWLPKWIEPKYILEQIKIPQIDYFSFGEKLAVVEQGTNDPEGMGYIFSKIATLLSTDFGDIETFVGTDYYQAKKKEFDDLHRAQKNQAETEYLYDVYISYPREVYPWVKEMLIPTLTEYLQDELGYSPQLYFDISEFNVQESLSMGIETAIHKSKSYVFVVTNNGLDNSFLNVELSSILKREMETNKNLLFPIIYGQSSQELIKSLPSGLRSKHFLDFSAYNFEDTVKSRKLNALFGQEVEKLAIAIANTIHQGNAKKNIHSLNKRKGTSKENREELLLYAKEYEEIRKKLTSSDKRTWVMENIVSKMKDAMHEPIGDLPKWTESENPGERLLAMAKLQKFPNIHYLDWLAAHVGDSERPFVGYQASVALYIASRAFGKENKNDVEKALHFAFNNIKKYKFQDPNQIDVISSALNELGMHA